MIQKERLKALLIELVQIDGTLRKEREIAADSDKARVGARVMTSPTSSAMRENPDC